MIQKNHTLLTSEKLFTLAVSIMLFFTACFEHHNHTRVEPSRGDLIGTWVPDERTLNTMRDVGGYDTTISTRLILRADGSFEMVNMPDWWFNGFGESRRSFSDNSGTWRILQDSDSIWGLRLTTSSGRTNLNLLEQRPPYRIHVYIGDPDNDVYMTFVKSN